MNILKVHECVKIENERFKIASKLHMAKAVKKEAKNQTLVAKLAQDESLYKKEIIELTARINNMHMELEENK